MASNLTTYSMLTFLSRQFSIFSSPYSSTTQQFLIPTKKTCIHLLKNCKSMNQMKQIQTQIFVLGLAQNVDAIKKIMAFAADPSVGNLCYAQRIFDRIETPSLFAYNVMIKAYTKSGGFRKALCLFDQMRVDGIGLDNYTYPFVCKSVGCLREASIGEKIHGYVVKCGDGFDCYVCNSVIDMYGELGRIGDARKVFDEMPERDIVSWNVLISGYVKCKRFEDAVGVYLRMRDDKTVRPDEATVVSTLSACIALKNLELGKEIHRYVTHELGFTAIIGNALLDMYCKCGCLDIAREIFDGLPKKNVICWTTMVSGYVNCGQLEDARSLFDKSPVKDIILWTAMINGYVQFNQVDAAMTLFQQMQMYKIKPDKFTVVALLTGCAQVGALEQGKWIHEYMNEHKITIDAVCGTALIDMYAKCGCIEKSLDVFYGLNEKDTASWTSIICALSLNGKPGKALELFNQMKESGFKPDDITFIGVLNACSHGGLVEEGWMHFESMKSLYQIEPKIEHYGCLIDLLGRAGLLKEAEKVINKIPKEKDDILVPVYGALLSACRLYGDVDMGEHLADRLSEIENGDSSIHTLLANIYAAVGRWEDVKKVRSKMRITGVKKEPGCSSIEVNGNIHEFLVGDASHPEMKDVYFSLNTLAKVSYAHEIYDVDLDYMVSIDVER
ncbi:putative tetratricopeptide-like helical domain superfamily [Helianthus annuus]|uniref:Putative pentatricopeptide repeat (PPR-like) superfamily protein n=1 Tax=Helianthus annuus TaxID=4232 RepID=A0A251V9D8_HELAN|nr:pentatricopeptide repeat-containing protein At1g31430 [Helianthus annuus]KAJ0593859.1 putative tetratricopeptide-like helical domain superfamily [Helianthus annuus]KAJ0608882.1 putative tetratricopeptide-like helical domain superfamily [Helianthus annuus]KAJ0936725.1 putative tetratricopeptide-like helical domain superfamily [Helianthus annuus]